MGCFDSTCAMTRLPIHSGDDIVYVEYHVVWNKTTRAMDASTYNLLQWSFAAFKTPHYEVDAIKRMEEFFSERHPDHKEKLENYVEERLSETLANARKKIVIVHGKYNDYGGIGDRWAGDTVYPPNEIRLENLYFFVHKAVWDAYAGENDYETLHNLNCAAMDARVELFAGNHPLGQQYSGSEFVTERRKILDIAEALLPTLYCSDEDYYDEEITEDEVSTGNDS